VIVYGLANVELSTISSSLKKLKWGKEKRSISSKFNGYHGLFGPYAAYELWVVLHHFYILIKVVFSFCINYYNESKATPFIDVK